MPTRFPHILYIGESTKQALRERVPGSLGRVLRGVVPSSQPSVWADTWNLTLRWAVLDYTWIGAAEKLLIRAHLPQLNSQEIAARSLLPKEHEMVIVNCGRIRIFLPVVASYYFWNTSGWEGDCAVSVEWTRRAWARFAPPGHGLRGEPRRPTTPRNSQRLQRAVTA